MRFSLYFCLLLTSCISSASEKLTILTWPNYLPEAIVSAFKDKTGIEIKQHYYESDETKDTLLNATKGNQFDLVVTSLFRMNHSVSRNWLAPITEKHVENLKHVAPKWRNKSIDPNQYCAPYLWGSLGIIYRKDKTVIEPKSWQIFLTSKNKPTPYKKLLNDSRDTMGIALLAMGYSINENDINKITKAGSLLYRQLPQISQFGALELSEQSELMGDDISMAMAYNGDALFLLKLDERLAFNAPSDGTVLWLDCMTLMQTSTNKSAAYQFLNYINQPKIAAQISETLYYATANQTARQYIKPEILSNPLIYLSKEIVNKSEFQKVLSVQASKKVQTIYSQLRYKLQTRR